MKAVFLAALISVPAAADPCCVAPQRPVVRVTTQAPQDKQETHSSSQAHGGKAGAQATTGQQVINLSFPQKTVVKTRKVKKVVRKDVTRPNRLLLLGGLSKTSLRVQDDGCCHFKASTERELDLGLQYIRDLGRVDVSAAGTFRGGMYLGVGFNW